jgi:uncharacterized protein with ATP-grasp and redox domains
MKVGVGCAYCLLHRGYREVQRATDDEETRMKVMIELLKMLGNNFNPNAVSADLGTKRDRIIKKMTGNNDPYYSLKSQANISALKLLPKLYSFVEKAPAEEKFRTTCLLSCIGNILEYDIPEHQTNINLALENLKEGFFIDETQKFKELLKSNSNVLFLADNAGEIVFDKLLINELNKMECNLTLVVKGGPISNDALMKDALDVGMPNIVSSIITTGTDTMGISFEESSPEFKKAFFSSKFIIAKGMAHWETLSEIQLKTPILHILRTKCECVASSIGAPINKNIAKLNNYKSN